MVSTTRARYWVLALPLAVLLFTFCLSAAVPAAADEPACGGLHSSERVCAQSGAWTPVLAVARELLPAQGPDVPGIPVSPVGTFVRPAQHHADPATPRAPPSLV